MSSEFRVPSSESNEHTEQIDECATTRNSEPGTRNCLDVAAGLVFRDGKLLITLRPADAHLGGLWEFPGGKRNPDETFEECLRRELEEELGIDVAVGELIETITHDYPEKTVHLKFFRCVWQRHEPEARGCLAFAWIRPDQLNNYAFPDADARLLDRLQHTPGLWK